LLGRPKGIRMSGKHRGPEPHSIAPKIILQIGVATVGRLFLNTARRFPYPFAPTLSRGLGVPLPAITSLIAANQFTAITGLFFAPLGDRWGYRIMLIAGLAFLAAGMVTGALFPFYVPVMIALFLAGLGKSAYDPAIEAYVGERIPFRRRGMAIGLMETSWAGSSLVGIPLLGFLIHCFGWRAPFFALGVLGFAGMGTLKVLIPKDRRGSEGTREPITIRSAWRRVVRERAGLGMLGFVFFVSLANDNFFVVYGAWLEEAFRLSIVALGLTTTVIGVAELLAEALTAALADRLGLQRSLVVGLILSGVSYVALSCAAQILSMALAVLFVVFLTFEFTIVTALSLSTELVPHVRATMMSGFFAAAGIGRVSGALIGGRIWMAGDITLIGVFSALMSAVALIFLVWGLRGWRPLKSSVEEMNSEHGSTPEG
jgi:DHA1 family inner membrane transport protein